GRLPTAFLTPGSSSFSEFLSGYAPELLPGRRTPPSTPVTTEAPHGTTIVAATFPGGVVMAGDRRATMGNIIAQRDIEKVFPADEYSCVGIAGSAGLAVEMVRLFQTELEHYEKVEGDELSLEGKANRLAQMLRGMFPMVMQGLVVVPIYAGFDVSRREGRIFRYDVIGGRYEEGDYAATGSGGMHAKASMKKRWEPGLGRQAALEVAVEALVDAGESDTATAGPDLIRGIFPTVHMLTADGVDEVAVEEVRSAAETVIGRRGEHVR
ncbi:MAG TPA: proteasome subunit beta, partial [Actinomycetota bacterium]|nr:proteasome subunit beta [Actinomycetota bacterium]